jgi:hypothetical protein
MDLGTIKDLLQDNQLSDPDHFADNVRLTFKNAMTYNVNGSYIYTSAETLLEAFERKFSAWQRSKEKSALILLKSSALIFGFRSVFSGLGRRHHSVPKGYLK